MEDLFTKLVYLDLYSHNGDLSKILDPAEVKFLWNHFQIHRYRMDPVELSDEEQTFLVEVVPGESLPLPRFMAALRAFRLPNHFEYSHRRGRFAEAGFDLYMADHMVNSRRAGGIAAPFDAETVAWLLEPQRRDGWEHALPRLVLAQHAARNDLRERNDIATPHGRKTLLGWFSQCDRRDYGLDAYPAWLQALADAPSQAVADARSDGITLAVEAVWHCMGGPETGFDLDAHEGRIAFLDDIVNDRKPAYRHLHLPDWAVRAAAANGIAVPSADDLAARRAAAEARHPATPAGPAPDARAADVALPVNGPLGSDGANLVGWIRTPIGIGVDAQLASRAFRSAGIPYCVIDAAGRLPPQPEQVDCGEEDAIVDGPRFDTDVVFLDTATQFRFFAFDLLHGTRRRDRTIGVCPWELPVWPEQVDFATSTIDTFWAATRYIADAFERHFPEGRVKLAPPAVVVNEAARRPAPALTEARKFRFLTVFDGLSSLHRKNPLAVVRAFARAFGDRDDVELVVKSMNLRPGDRGYAEFMSEVEADRRVKLVVETLDQNAVWDMVLDAHCVVSLHRAEGFGRNIAEAMLLERPVICSAFSGNLDFARPDNAFLVTGTEIEVGPHQYAMSRGQTWFDASVDHAADLMQRVVDDYDGALAVARRGRAFIEEHHSIAAAGRRYAALLADRT